MDRLWAPWRMEFIRDARSGKNCPCVFCELQHSEDDRKALILHRGKTSYVVLNKYPYINGHLLVVPNRHIAELRDLTSEECSELLGTLSTSVDILRKELEAEGLNCGLNLGKVAGAGILDHLHFHAVPRWVGDTNFMPVLGDTRALPEYMEQTYDRLIGGFRRIT